MHAREKIRYTHRRRPDSNRDMADLQSAALAIWLRRLNRKYHFSRFFTHDKPCVFENVFVLDRIKIILDIFISCVQEVILAFFLWKDVAQFS